MDVELIQNGTEKDYEAAQNSCAILGSLRVLESGCFRSHRALARPCLIGRNMKFSEAKSVRVWFPLFDRKPMGSVWSQPRIAGAVGLRLRWVVFWLRATVENVVFDSRMRSFCFKDG